MSQLKHLNKTPAEWSHVDPRAVCVGSPAQAENVLTMALFDIQKLALIVADYEACYGGVAVSKPSSGEPWFEFNKD